jgi:hypothetical protein
VGVSGRGCELKVLSPNRQSQSIFFSLRVTLVGFFGMIKSLRISSSGFRPRVNMKALLSRFVRWLDNLDAYEMPNRTPEEILQLVREFAPQLHPPGSGGPTLETIDHLDICVVETGEPDLERKAPTEPTNKD